MMVKTQGHPDTNFINNELELCLEAARRYQSNYYAWTYRRWVVQTYAYNLNVCNCYSGGETRTYFNLFHLPSPVGMFT